ncbi:GGDEF domain-containing protein [Thiomicrorhabdus sp. zzn3]|uniref:GGDEF domain-containing protein n=1 Tax=Thiomicrorhabdus sp. zzn3 TaxID=3039775 RepID=UPI002436D865|nr:GGDEF domain-containing protein [Thiomicrorhabdus sp. zzn3]MDG6777693.1 GGDEF domain-containing protein [Thiomicrorhabdus sp. zzn3]
MIHSLTRHFFILTTLLALSPAVSALENVKVQLRWLHQFQFAGYYIAQEKGFYQQQGLNVELIPGGPHALKPIDDVLSGKVDFAVTGSGVVIDRMNGKPVVALAAIMQTSPIVWITLKSSNIRGPLDLADKKLLIMPPPESAELLTMLTREGISMEQINIKPTSYRIEDLIDGQADAYDGYLSNEPYYLKQQGIEYNLINPRDYGINFYSDVLITSEQIARKRPELAMRFKQATLKGWEYALKHLEETVQLLHQKYAPKKTLDHLRYEARTLKKLIMPELVQVGHMNPERWQFIAESYQQLNMAPVDANLNGFLFEAPQERDYKLAFQITVGAAALLLIAGLIIVKFRRLSVELKKSNRLLSELATLDQLTKVQNRHGLVEQAQGLLSQAQRNITPCCFVMFDIDNFKEINDRYGHCAGDAALISFAQILTHHRKKHDLVARIGGEEFAMLLVGCNLNDATDIAQNILKEVRNTTVQCPSMDSQFSITASAGIALTEGSLEEFWHEADKALYQAKNSGKDRVVVNQGNL